MSEFKIDAGNYRKYANGQNRRPTDPATPDEIESALGLLFGEGGRCSTLEEADALASNPKGWGAFNEARKPEQQIFPEYVAQANGLGAKMRK